MWLARPVYESLPYVYGLVGLLCLLASWYVTVRFWSLLLLAFGTMALLASLVVWLKRRDYRLQQTEYDSRSLDE
ncbi:MAG TPA: hypothetical protein VLT59_00255 [Steroidobacteraceae bacterium]|nr:hypothetical protein [Steroidobacteraceae bacterium]